MKEMKMRIGEERCTETMLALGVCLCAAAVLMYLCSMSSPLYPLNIWVDANCLLTVGRVMKEGGVLYRDIYEQKGPMLYLIQMLGACISDRSFFGVFLMEVIFYTGTLFAAFKLMRLRAGTMLSLGGAVLFGAFVLAGRAFSRGNSAEEFCLPFLMTAVYMICAHEAGSREPFSLRRMAVCGLMAGVVALMKYTLLALFAVLFLQQCLIALRAKGIRHALALAGAFLGAMALPFVPWLIYFAVHGALSDFFTAYFYNNIFLYNAGGTTPKLFFWSLELFATRNLWVFPAVIGLAAIAASIRKHAACAATLLAAAAFMFVISFCMGQYFVYYPLPLSVFAAVGIAAVLPLAQRLFRRQTAAAVVLALTALVMAWKGSPNAFLRGMPLEYTAQGILAKQIEPGSSLLQYSFLDEGLYLTSGILPEEKFFVELNIDYEPMRQALDEAVREGRPDYVFISGRELPAEFDRYELVAKEYGYDDLNNWNKMLYLYRRKAE